MRGVSSLSVGITAGRDPVAMMTRSKVTVSSPPPVFVIRKVVEFSNAALPWMYYLALFGKLSQAAS